MNSQEFFDFFKATLDKMEETCRKKNSDYANSPDPFFNFTRVENLGIATTEQGFLTRMTDKLCRISNLIEKAKNNEGPAVTTESINDTLLDLATYSILLMGYLESRKTTHFKTEDLILGSRYKAKENFGTGIQTVFKGTVLILTKILTEYCTLIVEDQASIKVKIYPVHFKYLEELN